MKILVAEDDPFLQMLTGFLIKKWGYECDIATNGRKAVELAKANEGKYDLCLMDIDMPIMNGCEATKTIRQKTKYLPIMALTGNVTFQDKYVDFGMDDFLEKPYDPDMLYCKINELTVKCIKVDVRDNNFYIKKEMPMDSEHLKELRKLREKGLTKLCIRGSGCEVVVDERVQNKISHDLIGKKQELSEFLDRSEDKPGICHLYKANFMVNTKYLLPEELDEYKKNEEKILKECKSTVVKPLDD
ncbi:MAG: response regulator [Candidatus Firestonebacteria bacterium]|nr:response regulator [Candidatus Firestonebacteria bacterium]